MMWGNILFLVLIGVVIYMMMKGGGCCGGHDHGSHGGHKGHGNGDTGNEELPHKHNSGTKIEMAGNISEKDPVCGMEVNDNGIETSYLGKTFHFCSEQCKKLFNLNPNKYAGA